MIILTEDLEIISMLDEHGKAELLPLLFSEPDDISDLSVAVRIAYTAIKNKSDRISKKQSVNGAKGGAPKCNSNATKQPKTTQTTQTTQRDKKQPKQPSVTVTVTDTEPNNTPDMLKHITPKGVCDSPFDVALKDFAEMRKKIKAPLTERGAVLLLNELGRLAPNDENLKIKILEQSTMNDWKGVFPIRENSGKNRTRGQPVMLSGSSSGLDELFQEL